MSSANQGQWSFKSQLFLYAEFFWSMMPHYTDADAQAEFEKDFAERWPNVKTTEDVDEKEFIDWLVAWLEARTVNPDE